MQFSLAADQGDRSWIPADRMGDALGDEQARQDSHHFDYLSRR
jgi:hypothetical protein